MRKILFGLFAVISISMFNGCLVGNKISYEINLETEKTGSATVMFSHIRSDGQNKDEFEEDKYNLFEYMVKSKEFIASMKKEGKNVVDRELYVEDGKLYGKGVYKFDNLTSVENLIFEDGYYYITLAPDDSILTTNGEIIKSHSHKRIIWDKSYKTLKFEIMVEPGAGTRLIDLAPYYKNYYKKD